MKSNHDLRKKRSTKDPGQLTNLKTMDALHKDIGQKIVGDDAEAPITFTLLYSAMRDGFNVVKFHDLCDGKGPTLTVLHGKGVLFGGYTSKSWVSYEKLKVVDDDHAFLFCREEHESAKTIMFEKENNQPTITCFKNYGPTFGGTWISAYDLQVLFTSYPRERSVVNNQLHFNTVFCNSGYTTQPNGGQMMVKDVEVYQVEDIEKYKLYDERRESILDGVRKQIMKLCHQELSFKSLYSVSKHGCSASRFHEICDGKGPTMTVLYGRRATYGGYSSVSWSSNKNTEMSRSNAFLFCKRVDALTDITFYAPWKTKALLVGNKDYGPTFGDDLQAFHGTIPLSQGGGYFKSNGFANFNQAFKNRDSDTTSDLVVMDMFVRDIEVIQVQVKQEDVWRNIDLAVKKEQIVKEITAKLCPDMNGVSMYNILLLGNIGAGKSSFCNTLTTAFQNKIVRPAVSASSARSVTTKYRGYQFSVDKTMLPIRVFDTRGFEEEWKYSTGIKLMLDGKVEDGYDLSEEPPKQEKGETRSAKSSAMIHVVALVVDATKVEVYDKSMIEAINEVRQSIYGQELKLVVIATRFDDFDPFLKKFPDQIYTSSRAKTFVDTTASAIGVTSDMVLPFINYTNETESNEVIDKIALYALDVLIKEANDYRRIVRKPIGRQGSTQTDVKTTLRTNLSSDGVKSLRILCVGKAYSGKSTFIDSIKTVLERKRSIKATGGLVSKEKENDMPDTYKVRRYPLKILDTDNTCTGTNTYIVDMPGFTENGSISLEKIKWTVKGHVKNNTELVDEFSETSDSFVKKPNLKDQSHVVCIILDNESASDHAPTWEITMLKQLLKWIKNEGIPIVTILTKMDKLGPDLDEAISTVVNNFGVNRSFIFPVHNYVHEQSLDDERDTALCDALNCMLVQGLEYLEDFDDDD